MADPQATLVKWLDANLPKIIQAVSWSSKGTTASKLDWLIGVAERLMVLGAMLLLIFVVASLVCLNSSSLGNPKDIASAAKTVHDNWRAFIVVLSPLLYRVARQFLEETEEFLGVKRRRAQSGQELGDQITPSPRPQQSPAPQQAP